MPDVVAAACTSRPAAELLVEVLADAGVRAVVFADVERGVHGEPVRESAEVRVRDVDAARAHAALVAWYDARAEGVDPDELERQALEAGGGPEAPRAGEVGEDAARPAEAAPPAATTACPHCGAPVPEPWLRRVRRAFAALAGGSPPPGPERLCTACGHRWTPSG